MEKPGSGKLDRPGPARPDRPGRTAALLGRDAGAVSPRLILRSRWLGRPGARRTDQGSRPWRSYPPLRLGEASRWQRWPAGQIFPASLPYTTTGQPRNGAVMAGIAPGYGCAAAVDAALAGATRRYGCRAALRASYLDQPGGVVYTLGVLAFPDPRGLPRSSAAIGLLDSGPRPARAGAAGVHRRRPSPYAAWYRPPRPACTVPMWCSRWRATVTAWPAAATGFFRAPSAWSPSSPPRSARAAGKAGDGPVRCGPMVMLTARGGPPRPTRGAHQASGAHQARGHQARGAHQARGPPGAAAPCWRGCAQRAAAIAMVGLPALAAWRNPSQRGLWRDQSGRRSRPPSGSAGAPPGVRSAAAGSAARGGRDRAVSDPWERRYRRGTRFRRRCHGARPNGIR